MGENWLKNTAQNATAAASDYQHLDNVSVDVITNDAKTIFQRQTTTKSQRLSEKKHTNEREKEENNIFITSN